jgi:molybdopterin synthase catalytic subunit
MQEKQKKIQQVIQQGAISSQFIADSIAKHSHKTTIGAHTIFLGQVRKDKIEDKEVQAIEYSAYEEMAEKEFHLIREEAFDKYKLTCMHIHHSIGTVKAGEISLFVFVSAVHRNEVFMACDAIVTQIKERVPIWGKEILEDGSYLWKVNNKQIDNPGL